MTNKMFEKGALYAHYARPIEFKTCNTPRERRVDWHDRAAAVLEELYDPIASYCISEQQQDHCVCSLNQPSVHRSFMTFLCVLTGPYCLPIHLQKFVSRQIVKAPTERSCENLPHKGGNSA